MANANRLSSIQQDTEALASLLDDSSQDGDHSSDTLEPAAPRAKKPRLNILDSADDEPTITALLQSLQNDGLSDDDTTPQPSNAVTATLSKDWEPCIEQQLAADGLPNTATGRAIAINRLYQVQFPARPIPKTQHSYMV